MMNWFLNITLFVMMPLAFMHAGSSLMLWLIAKPDKQHPLNPKTFRRTLAVLVGSFGGLAWSVWTIILIIGLLRKGAG